MFGVANIIYLAAGIVSALLGFGVLKLVAVGPNPTNRVVSPLVGYSAIFMILALWSVALVSFGTAFDLNPYLLSH